MPKPIDSADAKNASSASLENEATAILKADAEEQMSERSREKLAALQQDETILSTVTEARRFSVAPYAPRDCEDESDARQEDNDDMFEQERAISNKEQARRRYLQNEQDMRVLSFDAHGRLEDEAKRLRDLVTNSKSKNEADFYTHRLADLMRQLGRSKIVDTIAADNGKSVSTTLRACRAGRTILADIFQTVTDMRVEDGASVYAEIAKLSPEMQHAISRETRRRRTIWEIEEEVASFKRLPKIDHGILNRLDPLSLNTQSVRLKLARLPRQEQLATIVSLLEKRSEAERRSAAVDKLRDQARAKMRTPALQTLLLAWDVATHADRSALREVRDIYPSKSTKDAA